MQQRSKTSPKSTACTPTKAATSATTTGLCGPKRQRYGNAAAAEDAGLAAETAPAEERSWWDSLEDGYARAAAVADHGDLGSLADLDGIELADVEGANRVEVDRKGWLSTDVGEVRLPHLALKSVRRDGLEADDVSARHVRAEAEEAPEGRVAGSVSIPVARAARVASGGVEAREVTVRGLILRRQAPAGGAPFPGWMAGPVSRDEVQVEGLSIASIASLDAGGASAKGVVAQDFEATRSEDEGASSTNADARMVYADEVKAGGATVVGGVAWDVSADANARGGQVTGATGSARHVASARIEAGGASVDGSEARGLHATATPDCDGELSVAAHADATTLKGAKVGGTSAGVLTTGAVDARRGDGKETLEAADVHASGMKHRSKGPKGKGATTALARQVLAMVDDVQAWITAPLKPGDYGDGVKRAKVGADTKAVVELRVEDGRIRYGDTSLRVEGPLLDTLLFTQVGGVYGTRDGRVYLDVRRFADLGITGGINEALGRDADAPLPDRLTDVADAVDGRPPVKKGRRAPKRPPLTDAVDTSRLSATGKVRLAKGKRRVGDVDVAVPASKGATNDLEVNARQGGRELGLDFVRLLLDSVGFSAGGARVELAGVDVRGGEAKQTDEGRSTTTKARADAAKAKKLTVSR